MAQIQNKIALITGAAGGFGEGIARLFAAEGARVLIADLDGDRARHVAESIGPCALAVRCDVSIADDINAAVDACTRAFGVPDIVVNNAGTTHRNQPMLEVDEATFDRVFNVNVKSIFHMTRAVVPLMRQRRSGSIINIGSTAGLRPRPGLTWYNASKGAVNLLSKSMAAELGPDNIRVNAICPVMGATGLIEQFLGMPDTPENRARIVASIPLGRMSTPEDVANAALWLASDASAFITGVELPVDGGRTI
ncbi:MULTISPECIES: glucose 1-dehydrogenase [unclassified Variovorax]|uniref:glucose 1-dehydrogenase n=1 Tax=unclassified Variovorax TaxID=663243 RepID=UPI002B238AD4|nr:MULTISPECIES: glucose 1-dehydrogenase [unclassified Variovorax]MEB0058449.1 glucose 1-dehydrogenase [Variovorax sp. LG9.2]MEB0111250.1 glucose 1-dehydrogenase [Variovorax sp. RTB1]